MALNGARRKVTVPEDQIKGEITISKIKYGGSTTRLNQGVGFGDKYRPYNKAIDIPCNGKIEITMDLVK